MDIAVIAGCIFYLIMTAILFFAFYVSFFGEGYLNHREHADVMHLERFELLEGVSKSSLQFLEEYSQIVQKTNKPPRKKRTLKRPRRRRQASLAFRPTPVGSIASLHFTQRRFNEAENPNPLAVGRGAKNDYGLNTDDGGLEW